MRMRGAVLGAALLASLLLAGCTALELGAVNAVELGRGGYRRESDLAYGTHPRQRLDVYVPTAPAAGPRPLVVFVHGGRWSSGSKDLYRFLAAGLAERGIVVVVANYRLYPEVRMAAAAEDVARAVVWAEHAAVRYGADPGGVAVMGHSAGAQLAALVATDQHWIAAAGGAPVRALVGLAGPYDFLPLTDDDLKDYFGPPDRYPESQPVRFVDAGSAPALLVHGLADTTTRPRNTESFATQLRASGVPVEVRLLPGEDHTAVLKRFARFYRTGDEVYDAIVQFLATPPARQGG
jgi:acetyl esterase/lipase